MDQHRNTPESNGWQTDEQTDSAQLQENLSELHKTIDRLQALQVDYEALIERVRENMRDSEVLEGEVNNFIRSVRPNRAGWDNTHK